MMSSDLFDEVNDLFDQVIDLFDEVEDLILDVGKDSKLTNNGEFKNTKLLVIPFGGS